jgi:ribosome-associated protein
MLLVLWHSLVWQQRFTHKGTDKMDNNNEKQDDEFEDIDFVSKTSVKKAMQELQSLGEELITISPKKRSRLPLSESLISEIELANKTKPGNARRRQIQRIGKLLRSEDLEGIRTSLEDMKQQDRHYQVDISQADNWSTRLIEEEQALSLFLNQYPRCDRQHLIQLIRLAKKEHLNNEATKKNPSNKYQQRLFKEINNIVTDK